MGAVAFESVWILHLNYENSKILRTRFSELCMSVRPILMYLFMDHLTTFSILHYTYLLHGTVILEKLIGFQLVKKFPAFYAKAKVHYRIHKFPPPVPILSQLKPVHNPISYFLKIHLNIILPSTPRSPILHYMASNIKMVSGMWKEAFVVEPAGPWGKATRRLVIVAPMV